MSERNYYVISDDNCRFESMTKEQILTAITEAVESHEISDVDTGFVTTLKEQNKNTGLKFWVGTQAQYNALETKESNCFYIITDEEDVIPAMMESIEEIQTKVSALEAKQEMQGEVLFEGTINFGIVDVAVQNLEKYTIVAVGVDAELYSYGLCYVKKEMLGQTLEISISGTFPEPNIDGNNAIINVYIQASVENGVTTIYNNKTTRVEDGATVSNMTVLKIIGIM